MTTEIGVDVGGVRWYASSDSWQAGGAVIIPIDQMEGMTNEVIGACVRFVATRVPYAIAENTALNLLSYGGTLQSIRGCPDPEKYRSELEPYVDESDTVRRAYDLIMALLAPRARRETHSPKERKAVAANYDRLLVTIGRRDGFACGKCRSVNNLQIDHVLPVSLGGTSELDNLQLLCAPCNNQKGATYADYRTWQGCQKD